MQMLLKNADMAIYRAKEQGRNTFDFFTSEMNEKMLRKHAIETNLRSALERRELLIHYQPVVNVLTGRMNSVEALLRWNHPKLGMISPVEFIPVAEESGLIVPISKWVLRNACLQSLAWQQTGAKDKIKLAINLSPRQFRESRLVDDVTSILQEIGLNGDHLVLELTESMIMHDIEYSAKVIKSLKELGIAISIDDFGTGYSSLNYLRRFPIDNIKIDRSFITELTNNADDAAIVTAIIAMAHSLKMKVIAEGVETLEQYSFLRERNCDEIQGYLISPAISAEQINPLLQKSSLLETGYSQCSRDALV
jgi:EAL domain-containing protein (putative c-di-GMP-specific phosphodiesterase class I)